MLSAATLNAAFEVLFLTSVIWLPIYIMGAVQRLMHKGLGHRLMLVMAGVGVPCHEFGHWLMVKLMPGHRVIRTSWFQPMNDGTLGFVEHAYRKTWYSPFTNLLIGLAPIVSGLAAFFILTSIMVPELYQAIIVQLSGVSTTSEALKTSRELFALFMSVEWTFTTFGWAFVSLSVLAFMLPSKADFQGAFSGIAMVVACLMMLVIFIPNVSDTLGVWLSVAFVVLPVIILSNLTLLVVATLIGLLRGVLIWEKEASAPEGKKPHIL